MTDPVGAGIGPDVPDGDPVEAATTATYTPEAASTSEADPPVRGRTGHARVDEALAALSAAADLPPGEQVAPLTSAHEALREALDSIGDV